MQYLVQCELNRDAVPRDGEDFWVLRPTRKSTRDFAMALVTGVLAHQTEVDERISRYLEHYQLHRLAVVDRNILRLAIYEMLHRGDIPPVVSINEAIELAKRYGAEESSRFVNGILDRVTVDLTRPLRTAEPARS